MRSSACESTTKTKRWASISASTTNARTQWKVRMAAHRNQIFAAAILGLIFSAYPAHADSSAVGTVYALTNASSGNGVAVFDRGANGTLTPVGIVATGGLGEGDGPDAEGLGSQGALALNENGHWLFAVNGGSGDISSFAVKPHGLTLVSKAPSNGPAPISLTIRGTLLYVLNYNRVAGGPGNITGFT